MKTCAIILMLGLFLPIGYSQQKALLHHVPFINATENQLGIEETGSGLLVGHTSHRIYLVTAYHVVAGMDRIDVRFQEVPTTFQATLTEHDQELDLAVLAISGKLDSSAISRINIKMEEEFTKGEPVFSIGHPFGEGWQINDRNILLKTRDNLDRRLAAITPEAIVPGCSGGPVFDITEDLIGLVLRENEINAPCIRAYTIKQKLKAWRIPSNLILTNEEWWNTLSSSWQGIFDSMVNYGRQGNGNYDNTPPAEFFQELFDLRRFECNNCGLTDLTPLKRLTGLKEIVVRDNNLSSIEALTNLKRLRYLDLSDNHIKSVAPLAELYEMENISLEGNKEVHDLSPLRNLSRLETVNLTKSGIHSIKPLLNLNNLKDVDIFLTNIPQSEVRLIKQRLPQAKIGFRPKREGLSHLIYFITHPARKNEDIAEGEDTRKTDNPLITPVYAPVASRHRSAPAVYRDEKQKSTANGKHASQVPVKETQPSVTPAAKSRPQEPRSTTTQVISKDAGPPEKADPQQSPPIKSKLQRETTATTPPAPLDRTAPTSRTGSISTPSPGKQARKKTDSRIDQHSTKPKPTAQATPEKKTQTATTQATTFQTKQAEPATRPQEALASVAHETKLRQLLLDRKPAETESQAFKWLGENPQNNLYRVYIVLGRVYQGKYDKARELWFFFKDKTLNDGQNFTDKVVAEIDRLEKLGATNTGIKRFRNQVATN